MTFLLNVSRNSKPLKTIFQRQRHPLRLRSCSFMLRSVDCPHHQLLHQCLTGPFPRSPFKGDLCTDQRMFGWPSVPTTCVECPTFSRCGQWNFFLGIDAEDQQGLPCHRFSVQNRRTCSPNRLLSRTGGDDQKSSNGLRFFVFNFVPIGFPTDERVK
jgi:hypothetical protein